MPRCGSVNTTALNQSDWCYLDHRHTGKHYGERGSERGDKQPIPRCGNHYSQSCVCARNLGHDGNHINFDASYAWANDKEKTTLSEMVFDSAAKKMLTECMEMATTRGSEYQDTWNLENQISIFTNETLNRIYKNDYTEADAPAASRLLRLAALVDTKISRIASGGRHKRDNYVDLINYLAVLGELREEYEKRQTGPKNPMEPAILGKDDPKRMKLVEEDLRFISEPNPD